MATQAVEVVGLAETRGLLARFEPDLLRRLNREVTAEAKALQQSAQANISGTGMAGDAYRIKRSTRPMGFSVSVIARKGTVGRGERWSSSPGVLAAVLEFAEGVRDARPENLTRTTNMLATLRARYGAPGRFLWDAWDGMKEASQAQLRATVAEIEAEYSARLAAR